MSDTQSAPEKKLDDLFEVLYSVLTLGKDSMRSISRRQEQLEQENSQLRETIERMMTDTGEENSVARLSREVLSLQAGQSMQMEDDREKAEHARSLAGRIARLETRMEEQEIHLDSLQKTEETLKAEMLRLSRSHELLTDSLSILEQRLEDVKNTAEKLSVTVNGMHEEEIIALQTRTENLASGRGSMLEAFTMLQAEMWMLEKEGLPALQTAVKTHTKLLEKLEEDVVSLQLIEERRNTE